MNNKIQWKNIRFVPILHNRMEFAIEVRAQFHEFRPDCIAVEYPPTLKEKILQAVKRLPLLSVIHYEEEYGDYVYLILEPTDGQVEAIRLGLGKDIDIHFIDRDTENYPFFPSPMPDSYAVKRIGHFLYCQSFFRFARDRVPAQEDILREKTMAYNLQRLGRKYERVLFVGGLYHAPGILEMLESPQTEVIGRRKREAVSIAHLHEESSRELLTEMPYLAAAYERARNNETTAELDRLRIEQELIGKAREQHKKRNREELSITQIRVMNRFARNYAFLSGKLVPDFYQLVVAARGAVDDNFAYELWEIASEYPWQTERPGMPVLRLGAEDLYLDQRRIRFHRKLKTMRRRLVSVPYKGHYYDRRERQKWCKEFGQFSICSYPPEDVVIEGYGQYLQKKAMEIKTEEATTIEPFVRSMLDGIDIRQTIREWGSGKIYVKEERPMRGKVGSVVVIFDPDYPDKQGKEAYPWRVTWLGEHEQESDMSFYSTPAGEVMDGPGISRCHYGGFMLTYPPMRVYDIWKDPFFDMARSKPERLLMAAIDYSVEKNVVYVAASPPPGWCRSFAAKLGKHIIYIPIGVFSPITLKKIREFHVLDGHHVRRYAHGYIKKR